MKTLKDLLNESLQINESSIPAKAKKYLKNDAAECITDNGKGWVIGVGFDFYDEETEEAFNKSLKLCLDLFGGVDCSGSIVTKPIKMDKALEYAESNGEDPEGMMHFVYNEDDKYPAIWTDFLIQWQ